jgi:hypothetical protein
LPALRNKPKLSLEAMEIVSAFRVLSELRTIGLEVSPISLREIQSYIDLYGQPFCDIDMFVALIMVADREYLTLTKDK